MSSGTWHWRYAPDFSAWEQEALDADPEQVVHDGHCFRAQEAVNSMNANGALIGFPYVTLFVDLWGDQFTDDEILWTFELRRLYSTPARVRLLELLWC